MSDSVDVVVVGGGVAGLWVRAVAREAGYRVVLVDSGRLGTGQTVASQGILHAGLKYALSPSAREAARRAAEAQEAWTEALAGRGIPDLRTVKIVSDRFCMWATPGVFSSVTAQSAAAVLKSGATRVEGEARPPAFRAAPRGFSVWEVPERAVDPGSLVRSLAEAVSGEIVPEAGAIGLEAAGGAGDLRVACARLASGRVVAARGFVLTAGAGNEELLGRLGVDAGSCCQRRPLHMVMASGAPVELFGHCIRPGSDKPRLTVTSARGGGDAGIVWYIGGDLAESGVERDSPAQIEHAKQEVAACLPWLDVRGVRWGTVRVDRAEGRTERGGRPDGPVVRRFGNVLAAWPTKLVMAPTMASMVMSELCELLGPGGVAAGVGDASLRRDDAGGAVASPPWEGAAWS